MKIGIDGEYTASVFAIKKKLKKYTCVFDIDRTEEFTFSLEDDCMCIGFTESGERKTVKYAFDKLKYCDVRSGGYILAFRDKKFLFLPVTDSEENNAELVETGAAFSEIYDGLHFVVSERLSIAARGERGKKKRMRVGFSTYDNPLAMIVMSIVAIFIATVFVMMKNDYAVVPEWQCTQYNGVFDKFREDSKGYNYLYFMDGEKHRIHQACGSVELTEKLETINRYTEVWLLIHPVNGDVVEVVYRGEELLSSEDAQADMMREAVGFMWLGYAMYAVAAFLIAYGAWQLIKERRS